MRHLHGAAPPASARPADAPSRHPDRRLSCGGGILSPGRCQGPGHRLLAPQLQEFSQGPPPCRPPAVEEGREGRGCTVVVSGWGWGARKSSPHHCSCGVEAALSPRTGVRLCCYFLKRRKGRDEFPHTPNGEEWKALLGPQSLVF